MSGSDFSPPLPMFPLGSVLLPGDVLPLHVFEPRYRRMVGECVAGDGRFGVVLIDQGSEVGGGDRRRPLGVIASILRIEPTQNGTLAVVAIGGRPIRVSRWLDDDPYPQALVETLDGGPHGWAGEPPTDELVDLAAAVVERAVALGDLRPGNRSRPATVRALISEIPFGPEDRYRLLSTSGEATGLLAAELLAELSDVQRFRLADDG